MQPRVHIATGCSVEVTVPTRRRPAWPSEQVRKPHWPITRPEETLALIYPRIKRVSVLSHVRFTRTYVQERTSTSSVVSFHNEATGEVTLQLIGPSISQSDASVDESVSRIKHWFRLPFIP